MIARSPSSVRIGSKLPKEARRDAAISPLEAQMLTSALETLIDYIVHPDFERPAARRDLLKSPAKPTLEASKSARQAKGDDYFGASVVYAPLLNKEEEDHLFFRMNYHKHEAKKIQSRLAKATNKGARVQEMNKLLAQSVDARDRILEANLRLVISIAKKYVNAANSLDELVSEGNISLMQAVEKFDISRGNRFSTYATRAIRNNLYHYVLDKHKKRQQVALADEQVLSSAMDDGLPTETVCVNRLEYVRRSLARVMNQLDEQKRAILSSRFGLDYARDPQTLKEIATELGVSRERIRQIQTSALRELRQLAQAEKIELPEDAG